MTTDEFHKLMTLLTTGSDRQIDPVFSKEIVDFLTGSTHTGPQETERFARNLLDNMVFAAGASGFVITALSVGIDMAYGTEDSQVQTQRRAELEVSRCSS